MGDGGRERVKTSVLCMKSKNICINGQYKRTCQQKDRNKDTHTHVVASDLQGLSLYPSSSAWK